MVEESAKQKGASRLSDSGTPQKKKKITTTNRIKVVSPIGSLHAEKKRN